MKKIVRTKGDVIVNDIKIGNIHYEFEYGMCIKTRVISEPVEEEPGYWTWKSVNVNDESRIVDYGVTEGMSHYGPNLYTYEAYTGCKMI